MYVPCVPTAAYSSGLPDTVSFTLRFRIFVASINLYESDA